MLHSNLLRIASLAVLAFAAACGAAPAAERDSDALRGLVVPDAPARPDFTLTDTEGEPYAFRERTEGKLALLFIGYTHCPDVCPVHLANLGAVLGDLPRDARHRIEVVFVSADPARDTPERIRTWLDSFDRDFVGLSGTADEVNAILSQLDLPDVSIGQPDERGFYIVGHPAHIIAFPPNGGPARAYYGFGTRQIDWLHDLPVLLEDTLLATVADGEPRPERSDDRAIMPAPATPDGPAALYITLRNPRPEADALVSASAWVAGEVTLHGYADHDAADPASMSMMHGVDSIAVPARGAVRLRPGGLHLMLEDLARPLAAGDTFTVELTFRSGRRVEAGALVLPYATVASMFDAERDVR